MKKILEKFKIKKNDFLNISGYSFQDSNSRIISNNLIERNRVNSGILSVDPSLNYAKYFNTIERNFRIDYFFPNLDEARIISGVGDYKEAANILHTKNIYTNDVFLKDVNLNLLVTNLALHSAR